MSAAPRPGLLVHPDVRLLRPVCAGAMGSVWAAEHRKLLTEVAVKLIASDLANDPIARARFEREATNASRVRSQHVVQILDYGVSPHGHPFIVMELLEGRDLRAHLQLQLQVQDVVQVAGALPASEALSITKQLCHALSKAHACGIVHRDLKPSNVFLCDSPQRTLVKLLDFGIAKETGRSGVLSTTGAVGTPLYMSPEQLTGERPVNHRSDIWALGVLAFEMLTGRRPFQGATAGALVLAIHTLPLPSARAINSSLPVAADEWFARACSRDASKRFDSAADAARALEFALHLAPSVSTPIEPTSPAARTQTDLGVVVVRGAPRRFPRAFAGMAVALLLVTSMFFAMTASSRGAREMAPHPPLGEPLAQTALPAAPPAAAAPIPAPSAKAPVETPQPREAEVLPAAIPAAAPVHATRRPYRTLTQPAASASVASVPALSTSQTPSASVEEADALTIPVDRK